MHHTNTRSGYQDQSTSLLQTSVTRRKLFSISPRLLPHTVTPCFRTLTFGAQVRSRCPPPSRFVEMLASSGINSVTTTDCSWEKNSSHGVRLTRRSSKSHTQRGRITPTKFPMPPELMRTVDLFRFDIRKIMRNTQKLIGAWRIATFV